MAGCEKSKGLTPAALSGVGGGLGFLAMGFFYPWLWLGVPACFFLGLVMRHVAKTQKL